MTNLHQCIIGTAVKSLRERQGFSMNNPYKSQSLH
uniref:Uncharacterized protein n=1 Tax=Anguilla anguilla TaxID=7936 RepID=A0A0E9UXP7_ANGAN